VPVCSEYWPAKKKILVYTSIITGIVLVINEILKIITIWLVERVRYPTHSERLTKITNGVFIAQFFNTGFLITLVSANFTEVPFLGSLGLFEGQYKDYTDMWYGTTGYLITQTMLINAFMPLGTEFIMPILKWWLRRSDTDNEKDPIKAKMKTKQTQIYKYIELYSEDEHIIHFKYSSMLNAVLVTFMYGAGMPILFPICMVHMFIFYCTERYIVAYHAPLPPALDEKLTMNAISWMRLGPIFFLLNGYWMISQPQMFESDVNQITYSTNYMSTNHSIAAAFTTVTWASPMLLVGLMMVVIVFLQKIIPEKLNEWGFTMLQGNIEVDEDLPNFFKSVKLNDADWLVYENKNLRENYGFNMVRRELEQKLDAWEMP
jgi:hypothetical protein